jgi:gamma-butyrobetaine hydroxylase
MTNYSRLMATDEQFVVAALAFEPSDLTITWKDGVVSQYSSLWLRDNAPEHRDSRTGQRTISLLDIPEDPLLKSVELEQDGEVRLVWEDGAKTSFSPRWLRAYGQDRSAGQRSVLRSWNASDADILFWEDYDYVLNNQNSRRDWLAAIAHDGVAFLRNVPIEESTVLGVASWIGFVRETNYGKIFDVRAVARPNNLAFTSLGLSVHTDNPYRDPVPGLQLLHCLATSGHGGESVFVDGFAVAEALRDEDESLYEVLVNNPVRFRFQDDESDIYAERALIECDASGSVKGIYYNDRSIAPFPFTGDVLRRYYMAYRKFAEMLQRPEFTVSIMMQPGDLVVFDNCRILHGRTAFEVQRGRRHLQGCYVDKDGLYSNLAVLQRAGEGSWR